MNNSIRYFGQLKTKPEICKIFTFNSFKDILSDNDINTIDTNAKTKTEDMGSMTRATKMSFCPLTVLCITEWEEM